MMKRIITIGLLLSLLLSLCACKKKPKETEAPTEESTTTQSTATEEATEESTEEPTEKPEALSVLEYGSFDGVYVEDGSDEDVEDIFCILVQNTSGGYLDYGVIHAQIGEKIGQFVVTGLPAGQSAWVLEKDRMTIDNQDDFAYLEQTVSQIRTEDMIDPRVKAEPRNGSIVLTNQGEQSVDFVQVYYKQLHSDGNFLGGITYTVKAENLVPGQSLTVLTGHSKIDGCKIVRIDCRQG